MLRFKKEMAKKRFGLATEPFVLWEFIRQFALIGRAMVPFQWSDFLPKCTSRLSSTHTTTRISTAGQSGSVPRARHPILDMTPRQMRANGLQQSEVENFLHTCVKRVEELSQ